MRTHGTLIKWNDDRGFGFIEPASGSTELFVHVSAFPRDGVRPRVGELVSFDVDVRKDGKPQAVRVMRPGTVRRPQRSPVKSYGTPRQRSSLTGIGGALLLAAIFAYAYFSHRPAAPQVADPAATQLSPSTARDRTAALVSPSSSRKPSAMLISPSHSPEPTATLNSRSTSPDSLFHCDGRTRCPQMTSCAEATYFLDHCPGTKMDGDHDGVPCQRQWCGANRED